MMPLDRVSTPAGGDDLASTDEVKVYKDEGEEDENKASENLSEDKIGLVTETEEVWLNVCVYYTYLLTYARTCIIMYVCILIHALYE